MSTKIRDIDLEFIDVTVQSDQEIQDIIKSKNTELAKLEAHVKGRADYPSPQLTPHNDIRHFQSRKIQPMNPQMAKALRKEITDSHNEKIKKSIEDKFQIEGPVETYDIVKSMNKNDLSLLAEKGLDDYLKHKDAGLDRTKKMQLDFDKKDVVKEYPVFNEFKDNSKSMDVAKNKEPAPEDNFE